MNAARRTPYHRCMRHALLAATMVIAAASSASAENGTISTGASPVITVVMRSGSITLRTWNRNAVQVDGAGATARHLNDDRVQGRLPEQIPAWSQTIKTDKGEATLTPETWVLPNLPSQPHDGVVIRGEGDVTVTVPNGTALLIARAGARGDITLDGYHNGAFHLMARNGAIRLRNDSGTGFAQTLRGAIRVQDSQFTRLRARNAIGPVFFSRCSAEQIEVSSIFGNVVYDNGTFSPGLARFESEHGDVALGVSGNAQIDAHSTSGKIETDFSNRVALAANGGNARATIGGSGPAVTVSSGTGSVLLYNGSFRKHAIFAGRAPFLKQKKPK